MQCNVRKNVIRLRIFKFSMTRIYMIMYVLEFTFIYLIYYLMLFDDFFRIKILIKICYKRIIIFINKKRLMKGKK